MELSEITSVKTSGGGYLVNGSLFVPAASGNRHYAAVEKWLALGNTPAPEFTQAQLDAQAVAEEQQWVKQEMEIADKEIAKFEDGHSRTSGPNVQVWRTYRNDLRDRVQGGVIVGPSRSTRPV